MNPKMLKALIRKTERMSGRGGRNLYGGAYTPVEIRFLIDSLGFEMSQGSKPFYDHNMAMIAQGKSELCWFYFHPVGKFAEDFIRQINENNRLQAHKPVIE